jgi:protoporphyrinogen/coproporphyrinogen III oxidase
VAANPWIIVGGGASGLAAAFFLRRHGLSSIIVERDRTSGGRMGSLSLGSRELDCGGKNIGKKYRLFREFATSLHANTFEHFGLSSSQVIDGQVVTFDARARWKSLADITRGLSIRDMRRFGHVLWRVMSEEAGSYLGTPLSRKLADRFDDRPASEYFSPAFCRRVLRPMSVRMNGAEPDEIYLGNLNSNVGMIVDTYELLVHGLTPLFRHAQQQYDIRLDTTAESLLFENGRIAGARIRSAQGTATDLRGSGVILATPAHASAALTDALSPALARKLRKIAYFPVTVIIVEYDRPIFTSNVRALAFEDDKIVSNAGAYGANALNLVRYTYSGRTARHMLINTDPEQLLREAEVTLARHIPVESSWRLQYATRSFSPGLCAYLPHHDRWMGDTRREIENVPNLYLTGDYLQGASIEACFRASFDCVSQLTRDLARSATARQPG